MFESNVDILEMYDFYFVPINDLKSPAREQYIDSTDDDGYVLAPAIVIENFENAEHDYFDTESLYEDMYALLHGEDYFGFVAINYNADWRNRVGYKMFNSVEGLLNVGYDYSLRFIDQSDDGRITMLMMSSHDVPTGGEMIIVGIPDEDEYEFLDYEATFEDILSYVESAMEHSNFSPHDQGPLEESMAEKDKTNTAYMDMDLGTEVVNQFVQQGWDIIATREIENAVNRSFKSLKRLYPYTLRNGLYGSFYVPVDELEYVKELIAQAVLEVREAYENRINDRFPGKPKPWNRTGKLK